MTARFGIDLMIVVLACVGLWVTVDKAAAGTRRVWEWWRRDRVSPLLEEDAAEEAYCYPECPPGCDCSRLELPPERSAAALGFERERRAPPWEAFQRLQYEAMGLEFPSGLMARVRELTP